MLARTFTVLTSICLLVVGTPANCSTNSKNFSKQSLDKSAASNKTGAAQLPADVKIPWLKGSQPYLDYQGDWDADKIKKAGDYYKLIIVSRGLSVNQVDDLHKGTAKPKVFGYISIGEDGLTSSESEKPAVGDGRGPSRWDGTKVIYENKGVASYYVDEYIPKPDPESPKELINTAGHDDLPDRNNGQDSGSLYVNAGDETWQRLVIDEAKRLRELHYDGIFLDTLDTASNTELEWTQEGGRSLIRMLNGVTPNIIINRGLYFFKKGANDPKVIELQSKVWGVMFEDFYTEKDYNRNIGAKSPYFNDYQKNYVPELVNFQVFALDYINSMQSDCKTLYEEQKKEVDKEIKDKKRPWHNFISFSLDNTLYYSEFKCGK